jgi:hypothetical protein
MDRFDELARAANNFSDAGAIRATSQKGQPTACIVSPFAISAVKSRVRWLGLLRCVGQALATEAIAECIRSGSVGEAESNIGLLCLVPTPATADGDASVTVERINL